MEPRTSLQAKDYHYIKFDLERLTTWSDAFFLWQLTDDPTDGHPSTPPWAANGKTHLQ